MLSNYEELPHKRTDRKRDGRKDSLPSWLYSGCSQPGCFLFLRGNLEVSGDIFDYYNLGGRVEENGVAGIYWVEATDVAKHLTMHRTVPSNKEFSDPKCQ